LHNSQEQQHSVRGDDRERMTSARQAAEALFTPTPKRQVTKQPVPDSVPPAEPIGAKTAYSERVAADAGPPRAKVTRRPSPRSG